MAESQGFKVWFRPFLEAKLNQAFPDPSQFKKEEEFTYAAKTTSIFKKVIAELLQWVDGNIEQAKYLEKKQKGEIKDHFDLEGGE
jgi:hypothetical protein